MRILALDWGSVRVGGAVSDESGKLSFALDHFFDTKSAFDEIPRFVYERGVEKIIIGNPLNLQGKDSRSTDKVREFSEKLGKLAVVPIEFLDERFSSKFAQKILAEQGVSEADQRGAKDNIAAQLMLQYYLDGLNANKNQPG